MIQLNMSENVEKPPQDRWLKSLKKIMFEVSEVSEIQHLRQL